MTETEKPGFPGRLVVVCAVAGVASGLASVAVLRLIQVDLSPAVIAAVAGAVAGSVAPTIVRRKCKGTAAQQADATDAASRRR